MKANGFTVYNNLKLILVNIVIIISSAMSYLLYFRDMLELGKSDSWTRALETITGSDTRMDAGPLLEYFKDLQVWLEEDNRIHGRTVGWKTTVDPCESC